MPKTTFFNLASDKRARIVELAIEEFATHSFSSASISRMVQKAGIAKGSFYQYFDDKRDLYQWLVVEHIASKKRAFLRDHAPDPDDDFFTALEKLFRGGLRFGLGHPRLMRIASWIWPAPHDQAASTLQRHFRDLSHQNLAALVRRGQEGEHLRADLDPDIAADLLGAVLQEGLNNAVHRRLGVDVIELCARPELAAQLGEEELDQLVHGLVDILRSGLSAADAPTGGAGELFDVKRYFSTTGDP